MKKYIIKYADGREQRFIRANYNSRKEAEEALLIYLCDHNEKCDDSSYLSPFDFTVEEVDVKEINEIITDFECAKSAIMRVSPEYFIFSGKNKRLEATARFVPEINFRHLKALAALNKLFSIAQAWNNEDGFVPDFSNESQCKWFPWFRYDMKLEKFVCSSVICSSLGGNAYWGSRLCFKTYEHAEQFGKQFEDLYNDVFI